MQPGYSKIQAAVRHGIKQSALASILKDKNKILAVANVGKSKNVSQGKGHKLKERLFEWFLKTRSHGVLLDRPLLRTQSEKMAWSMNLDTSLKFTHGWLCKFRKRFGIDFK